MLNKEHIRIISQSGYAFKDGWFYKGKPTDGSKAIAKLRKLIKDSENSVEEIELEIAALSTETESQEELNDKFIQKSEYLRNFYWKSSNGNLTFYYSPFGTKEVASLALGQDEGYRPFLNAIREIPRWLSLFLADYAEMRQHTKKLTVEQFASQLFKTLILTPSQQLTEEPRSLSWDSNQFSFKTFNPEQIVEGKTPAWNEFLTRLSNKEIFLAFVWSIFDEKNFGRQVLWLKGPGNDGKSRVINAISRYLGSHAVAAISQGTVGSQFFSSFVYGKRLVVFGDCMHTRLISTSAIHTLVGNDYASIEGKGKQAFAGKIYAKVIIGSNYAPELDNTANQVSRLLYVTVKPLAGGKTALPMGDDGEFEDRLVNEMPHLLFEARKAYLNRCPNHGRINISDIEVDEMLTKTKSDMQEFVEKFCEENLIFEQDSILKCADLNSYFTFKANNAGLKVNQQLDLNLLNRYVEEKLGLEKRKNGMRIWVGAKMNTQFETWINSKTIY